MKIHRITSIQSFEERSNLLRSPDCPTDAFTAALVGNKFGLAYNAVHNPNCPSQSLTAFLERYLNDKRPTREISYWYELLEKAVMHPNCPSDILERFLKYLGNIGNTTGSNLAIGRMICRSPNCPPLAKIEWMRSHGMIETENPDLHSIERPPPRQVDPDIEALKKLIQGDHKQMWYKTAQTLEEVRDPHCPSEVLATVLNRGKNDEVSWYAAQNPNCPPEALVAVLNRGKDDWVSWGAAQNPNCPALEKINWMRATGKIETEDPTKHVIEYSTKPQRIDPDIAALEKLIK